MWTVPSVRVAANGLPRGLHVSASGAVWYPTERVSRWENHPLKIRHWYLWIILVPSEGMICSATSTWNRLKLRLHSSSCSTWALGRWLQKFSENLHDIRHKFHWHIDLFWGPKYLTFFFLRASAPVKPSSWMAHVQCIFPGVIFQQIPMKHSSLSQKLLASILSKSSWVGQTC